jgi:hypothetical protein
VVRGAPAGLVGFRDEPANRPLWTKKILPVVLPGQSIKDISLFLLPHNADHYIITELTKAGVRRLVSALTTQPMDVPAMDNTEYDDLTDQPNPVRQTAFSTEHSSVQQAGRDINIYHRTTKSMRFKRWTIFSVAVVPVAVGTWIFWPTGADPGTEWHEVLRKSSYELAPATITCLDGVEDKVDLDTGKRGHGDQPSIPMCTADGGLADLILETDSIHTSSKNRRNLLTVERTAEATASFCASRIASPSASRQYAIPLGTLADGAQLCVQTDRDRIARVTVAHVPTQSAPTMLIDFVVWQK